METTTASPSTSQVTRWTLDPVHSTVGFSVRHLMITNVRGEFQKVTGEVLFDPAHLDATRVTGTVEVASINTREAQRDTHLKSGDFFELDKYPTMTFSAQGARSTGEGRLDITGALTLKGVTRDVTFHVSDITAEHPDPWGNKRIGATATAKIKRSDFGIVYNMVIEAGGVAISDEVNITLDVSLVKAK